MRAALPAPLRAGQPLFHKICLLSQTSLQSLDLGGILRVHSLRITPERLCVELLQGLGKRVALDDLLAGSGQLIDDALIHALGEKVLGVYPRLGVGGTWAGCAENLKRGWSPLFLRADGRPGTEAILERGAVPVTLEGLRDLESLTTGQIRLF